MEEICLYNAYVTNSDGKRVYYSVNEKWNCYEGEHLFTFRFTWLSEEKAIKDIKALLAENILSELQNKITPEVQNNLTFMGEKPIRLEKHVLQTSIRDSDILHVERLIYKNHKENEKNYKDSCQKYIRSLSNITSY